MRRYVFQVRGACVNYGLVLGTAREDYPEVLGHCTVTTIRGGNTRTLRYVNFELAWRAYKRGIASVVARANAPEAQPCCHTTYKLTDCLQRVWHCIHYAATREDLATAEACAAAWEESGSKVVRLGTPTL